MIKTTTLTVSSSEFPEGAPDSTSLPSAANAYLRTLGFNPDINSFRTREHSSDFGHNYEQTFHEEIDLKAVVPAEEAKEDYKHRIFALKMHEHTVISKHLTVIRVPGGWIYESMSKGDADANGRGSGDRVSSCFVPEPPPAFDISIAPGAVEPLSDYFKPLDIDLGIGKNAHPQDDPDACPECGFELNGCVCCTVVE